MQYTFILYRFLNYLFSFSLLEPILDPLMTIYVLSFMCCLFHSFVVDNSYIVPAFPFVSWNCVQAL